MKRSEHPDSRIRLSFLVTAALIASLLIAELAAMYKIRRDVETINLELVPRISTLQKTSLDLLELRQRLQGLVDREGVAIDRIREADARALLMDLESLSRRLAGYDSYTTFDERLKARAAEVFRNLEQSYFALKALTATDAPSPQQDQAVHEATEHFMKLRKLGLEYMGTFGKLVNEELGYLTAKEERHLQALDILFNRTGWGLVLLFALLVGIAYANSRLTGRTIATYAQILERKLTEHTAALEKSRKSLSQLLAQERHSQEKVLEKQTQLHKTNQALTRSLAQLKQTQSAMAQQEKLASIGHLAAGVAHEINNPLGFILSNINRMNEYIEDLIEIVEKTEHWLREDTIDSLESFRQKYLDMVNDKDVAFIIEDLPSLVTDCGDGGDRVKEIIKSLKDFSRMDSETEHFSRHNIRVVVEKSLNLLRNEIKYDVDLEFSCPESLELDLLPGPISQVISNIVINAVAAIRKAERRGKLKIFVGDRDAYVMIVIADNGCGIPPENIDRIFDPFFTTKKVGEGTGLGMNIAYDIVKNRHGGELTVTSEVGVGTEFSIHLPKQPYHESEGLKVKAVTYA